MKNKVYRMGIYARLSTKHGDRKDDSIENQIQLCMEYIDRRDELIAGGIYTDIGKSGRSFERKGLSELLENVAQHRIDGMIVKDLSRLGRDYLTVGELLEIQFPLKRIRFISIAENLDTERRGIENGEVGDSFWLGLQFKNLVNEMYAKDISAKVRAVKKRQREKGSYLGAFAPYGMKIVYKSGVRLLVHDEQTGQIVEQIRSLRQQGFSIREIQEKLYREEIHCPSDYRKTGHIYRREEEALQEWPQVTLRYLLRREEFPAIKSV